MRRCCTYFGINLKGEVRNNIFYEAFLRTLKKHQEGPQVSLAGSYVEEF